MQAHYRLFKTANTTDQQLDFKCFPETLIFLSIKKTGLVLGCAFAMALGFFHRMGKAIRNMHAYPPRRLADEETAILSGQPKALDSR